VELFDVLDECARRATEEDLAPLLHIECHGDEDGFQLADGSVVDWLELKPALTSVNIAMQLNLMVIVAACTGGSLAKAVSVTERAPLWGLIGPTKAISPNALEAAYGALYRELLCSKSPSKAVQALDAIAEPGMFWRATAQGLFEAAWRLYRQERCTPEMLRDRSLRLQDELLQRTGKAIPPESIVKALLEREPHSFDRFCKTFFMHDLYPSHAERFNVPYVALASPHVG